MICSRNGKWEGEREWERERKSEWEERRERERGREWPRRVNQMFYYSKRQHKNTSDCYFVPSQVNLPLFPFILTSSSFSLSSSFLSLPLFFRSFSHTISSRSFSNPFVPRSSYQEDYPLLWKVPTHIRFLVKLERRNEILSSLCLCFTSNKNNKNKNEWGGKTEGFRCKKMTFSDHVILWISHYFTRISHSHSFTHFLFRVLWWKFWSNH